MNTLFTLLIAIFAVGYAAIIFEYTIKINKTAVALFVAVILWLFYVLLSPHPLLQDIGTLSSNLSDVAQIIFFLLGAMTLVELIDSHKGFKFITDIIHTSSKRKMLWIIALLAFFVSAILDNLTTTILMISLLRKLVPNNKDRFLLGCIVVVAANAGGAWTPIGDVTTTMLWINGQLSSLAVMKALIVPSLVSLAVPLLYYTTQVKGKYTLSKADTQPPEPGAKLVFWAGLGALVFVPIFKALTGLPPFMGMLISLATLWIITDILHHDLEERQHLKVPHIFTKIDTSSILFFLGILLCINALEAAGILESLAHWLNREIPNQTLIATFIGLVSAVIDNVPLVAASIGMYPLESFPMDSSFWHLIAYAAGTGGSILIIGSAAGVAFMGIEKVDFMSYVKKASLPILAGYLAGIGTYVAINYLF